jgi:hypothetical protein
MNRIVVERKYDGNRLLVCQVTLESGKKTGEDKIETTCPNFGDIIIPFFRGQTNTH